MRGLAPIIATIDTEDGMMPVFHWILPRRSHDALVPVVEQVMAEHDRRILANVARSRPGLALDWSRVRRARVPAVVVVGSSDALVSHSRRLAARWPGARLVVVPSLDHADILHAPRAWAAVRVPIAAGESPGTGAP